MQEKEDKYDSEEEIDDNDDGYDDGHNLKMKMNMTTQIETRGRPYLNLAQT